MLRPTVAVFVLMEVESNSLGLARVIVSDGASLNRPKMENFSLNVWSIRTLPAFKLAEFENPPVYSDVKPSEETAPFGIGNAFRNAASAAGAFALAESD